MNVNPDIDKGVPWNVEISRHLEECRVGIICVTKENIASPWLCFEAGALSKTRDAHACTFLLDVKPSDVPPPLGTFQHTIPEKEDIRKLMHTINATLEKHNEKSLSDELLNKLFERLWPELDESLQSISTRSSDSVEKPSRSDREILEEILGLVRSQEIYGERNDEPGLKESVRIFSSSDIIAANYDLDFKNLDITFAGGVTYLYLDVPETVFNDLMNSKSKGSYFTTHINRYLNS